MMVYSVFLDPRGAFHMGERGIGYEETSELVHADTLFGALCGAWGLAFGEEALSGDLLPDGRQDWEPPFLFSSAFPRAGNVRLYPKPLLHPPGDPGQWKEVEWVSESVFCAWLSGRPVQKLRTLQGGRVAVMEDEWNRILQTLQQEAGWLPGEPVLWRTARAPRVTLDVQSHASELWHFGRLHFAPGCGFHLWVEVHRLEDRLWTAFRILGDVGLGGDRSSGHGLFMVEIREEAPPWPASDRGFVTLSPVYPTSDQVGTLLGDGCAYKLLVRTGWIGSVLPTPYRRKSVRLVAEGSVLVGSTQKRWGALVDVTPDGVPDLPHRVYRWGYAFPAGVSQL